MQTVLFTLERRIRILGCCAAILLASGCADRVSTKTSMDSLVDALMPRKIITQRTFTRVIDLDDDGDYDAIDAVVIAEDELGDPTKCIGIWHFELYTLRLASGDRLGQRLAHWPVPMETPEQMQVYWDRVSRFYRFTLDLETALPPGQYVLNVTLRTPAGENLFDEFRFDHMHPGSPR